MRTQLLWTRRAETCISSLKLLSIYDNDIKFLAMNIDDIAATIEIMAEYNLALMMMRFEKNN